MVLFFFRREVVFPLAFEVSRAASPALAFLSLRWVAFVGFVFLEVFLFVEAPRRLGPIVPFNEVIICLRAAISEESFSVFFFVSFWTSSLSRERLTESSCSTAIWASVVAETVSSSTTSFFSSSSMVLARCYSR